LKSFAQNLSTILSRSRVETLEQRLTWLEKRVANRRWAAVEDMGEYLVVAEVPGDYCEFGIYRGDTFQYAARLLAPAISDMRFVAFDSFMGLPKPMGIDALGGYTGHFHEGEFAMSRPEVERRVAASGADMSRCIFVEGWFDRTLNDETAGNIGLNKIAAAWIDCDLYASTVPVLNFIGPRLSEGSILLFDDWRAFRNLADRGQQLATAEWLARNSNLTLRELFSFGSGGIAFSVKVGK
jgi:hypothetical protein